MHNQVAKISLKEVYDSKLNMEFDNDQVRRLSSWGYSVPFGHCGNEMLEAARLNLDRDFSFVGIMERFDESLLLLRQLFQWNNIFYIRKNVTKRSESFPVLDDETLQIVTSHNQLDIDLYDEFLSQFDRKMELNKTLQRQVGGYKLAIMAFQLANRFYRGSVASLRSSMKAIMSYE